MPCPDRSIILPTQYEFTFKYAIEDTILKNAAWEETIFDMLVNN